MAKQLFWLGALVLGFAVLIGDPGSAVAQAQAAVLEFDGRGGSTARRAVVRALTAEMELTEFSRVADRAEMLGEDIGTDEGAGRVAGQLSLSFVIRGEMVGRGRNAALRLWAVDISGQQLSAAEISPVAGRRGRAAIAEGATALVREANQVLVERAREIEREAREAAELERQLADETALDDEMAAGDRPWLIVYAGFGGRGRQATIETQPERSYNAPLLAELNLGIELSPFASDSGSIRGLLFALNYGQSLGARSVDPTTMEEIETSAMRLGVDLGYMAELGDGGVRVGGLAGYALDSFTLGDNSILASSSYSQLRLGGRVELPLLDETLGLRADFGFRYALGLGDFAGAYGAEGGGTGIDVGLQVGGRLEMGLSYRATVGYLMHFLSFEGPFAVGQATGGSDSALLLGASLGYAL